MFFLLEVVTSSTPLTGKLTSMIVCELLVLLELWSLEQMKMVVVGRWWDVVVFSVYEVLLVVGRITDPFSKCHSISGDLRSMEGPS